MPIFLVRHAQSAANIDEDLFRTTGDHAIAITEHGHIQARKAGEFIENYITINHPDDMVRLWASPYLRTTETAQDLQQAAKRIKWDSSKQHGGQIFFNSRLREREFGYFDGLNDEQIAEKYPDQWQHYQKNKKEPMGKYWAKPYGGESVADVSERLDGFKESLFRDINKGVTNHTIVNHGLTLRAFVNNFFHLHPAHFMAEKNPANTAVRLLDINSETGRWADYGYIYDPDEGIYMTEKPAKLVQYDYRITT
jgi:broad specificity phosphatase PhoE